MQQLVRVVISIFVVGSKVERLRWLYNVQVGFECSAPHVVHDYQEEIFVV